MNKICVTPKASLGFHQAYYDKAFTFGMKVTSLEGTSDLMSYYPDSVKDWIRRNGGLATATQKIKNAAGLFRPRAAPRGGRSCSPGGCPRAPRRRSPDRRRHH